MLACTSHHERRGKRTHHQYHAGQQEEVACTRQRDGDEGSADQPRKAQADPYASGRGTPHKDT
ncbi:hypothetical protein D3C71_1098090 [compost metagenome]